MKQPLTARLKALREQRLRTRNYRPGQAPGSLQATGHDDAPDAVPARISLLRYTPEGVSRDAPDVAAADCRPPVVDSMDARLDVAWIHVQGRPTPEQLQVLGAAFALHPLALEDVLHREARAKSEAFDAQQFVVLDHLGAAPEGGVSLNQVSFFLGKNWLISVSEGPPGLFDPVRKRIRSAASKICEYGADYLLYALADVVVDSGFPLLEDLGDRLELLEDEILAGSSPETRNRVHYARRELMQMRRAWWPQRDVIAALMRDDSRFLSDTTRLYLRDCHDHSVIIIDFVETYREMASSLLDLYLSAMSLRLNDTMKVFAVIATIFLPLTFLTSLYGMNFDTDSPWNMPELHWRFGYLYVLATMAVVAAGMLAWFRRKRWL
ncbi:MAG: magnesium/cobalt transporter CorA [Ottowia sp.]|nr:magnesium/cobalt transporter CorA [Ottowia sp.]